ncbi:hypothetical protein [Klebsiella sp. R19]|uniref:hypothetical protein n=1 Tax=Klebsiella sp. R19 TaxID=3409956 RepID=UPI003B5B12E0
MNMMISYQELVRTFQSSYEKPYEIARYGHNGSAGDRSNAFSCAMNKARSLQNYSGAKLDYNVYEETA